MIVILILGCDDVHGDVTLIGECSYTYSHLSLMSIVVKMRSRGAILSTVVVLIMLTIKVVTDRGCCRRI